MGTFYQVKRSGASLHEPLIKSPHNTSEPEFYHGVKQHGFTECLPGHIGQCAEKKALEYLLAQGLCLVIQNFQCRMGEIDLIMRDKCTSIFIEVRRRRRCGYGGGVESVTKTKQRKIIRTAQYYLQRQQLVDALPCRFDVIGIEEERQTGKETLSWIKHAFEIDL